MAIKLTDLINNPKVRREFFRRAGANAPRCCICKEPFTEAQKQAEEIHQTKDGPACSDCYFEALGKAIEEHPICSPRVHRG